MSFSLEMKRAVHEMTKGMEGLLEQTTKALFISVVEATPVGNPDIWDSLWKWSDGSAANVPAGYVGGRLRTNWQTTKDRPASGEIDKIDPDLPMREIQSVLGGVNFSKDFNLYLTNNLPYADRVENGWSRKQRPEGMVRINLVKTEANLRRARL